MLGVKKSMDKRYEHTQCDQQMLELWQKNNTYAYKLNNPHVIAPKHFSIDTPPPTISGSLHIGHIFSYTQTDIIARYKRMTGHNVFYPYGFDCNGLATERFVEKKHDTNVHKIGRDAFIDLCLKTTTEAQTSFVQLWQNMGLSANLHDTYSTIAPDVQKLSQQSFLDLVKKGKVYKKEEPAMYCTTMQTSVAQAELEDIEKETLFTDIAFKDESGNELVIATTRPELLPSCVALIFNPNDTRYGHLIGKQAIVPIYGHSVPILQDEAVQIEKGTGLVMVCTFGDKTDVEWWKKFKLPYKQSVGFDGRWTEITGPLAGLKVQQAREKILELLHDAGAVKSQKKIVHSVAIYERSKKEIEYVVLPQWFVKIIDYKKELIDLADQINWYPVHMKSRYKNWVENLNWDWCISRQRVFGIPFPVWYEKDTGNPIFADESELPINPLTSFPKKYSGNTDTLIPEKDVMDTWNTSSITPYICKQLFTGDAQNTFSPSDFVPMSMRPQAHDIIRTWAFYTIVKSWMHEEKIPWSDIVISGYVLSADKEKISKSKNNAPTEPEKLLQLYAPDAIRFWTASGTLGQDIAFSEDKIINGAKTMNKLWNAFKFSMPYLEQYAPDAQHNKKINVVNTWMQEQTQNCVNKVHEYFKKYEFGLALQTIETLFWADYCDNYIEIVKDQFFKPENYSAEEKQETLYTLYTVGLEILKLYALYMPFITEQIYQYIFAHRENIHSIHLQQLAPDYTVVDSVIPQMNVILSVIEKVRAAKTNAQLALKTEINILSMNNLAHEQKEIITQNITTLKGVCKAHEISFNTEATELVQHQKTITLGITLS
ncbi:valine--tRNA ligase [bacterium]|nr:valine--tRNA ligase [bacterium]